MDDDEIAKWAEKLSPEGSPGVMSRQMRQYLGDEGYEKMVALNDTLSELSVQRSTQSNNILTLAAIFMMLYGFVGLVVFVAFAIKFIF